MEGAFIISVGGRLIFYGRVKVRPNLLEGHLETSLEKGRRGREGIFMRTVLETGNKME